MSAEEAGTPKPDTGRKVIFECLNRTSYHCQKLVGELVYVSLHFVVVLRLVKTSAAAQKGERAGLAVTLVNDQASNDSSA